jgi:hypothetical protein
MSEDLWDALDAYKAEFKDSVNYFGLNLGDPAVKKQLIDQLNEAVKRGRKLTDSEMGLKMAEGELI